ncbi:enoyl-CoA hydratase [Azotobacter beijerinckii]|uniref:enoyl-CoA hydratase n=1 Tax=Azotobacter beijerinckii TaxID=170623 RepID=UPI002955B7CE|nr:enoyl-CoA hydratase [Azotobacter beijerinckii]MDV7211214.1 enoyl-CoA hydratase [Azotobacter beijerinckii]
MNSQQEAVVHLDIRDDGVAIVQIDRPESKNALNSAVRQQLAEHFRELARNKSVRAIVLTGGEQFFVAGADIREFASASPVEMYQRHTEYLWEAIGRCPKPVVAAVNGFALGGGCELAMHCDIIIAGESARFGQPEVKLGLMPGAGGTQRLIRAVGKFQAMRIALTGCMVKAPEALAIGMISEVVSDERTLPRAVELASEIAALPPLAVAQIKEVLLAGADLPLEGALALERKAFQLLFDSKDQKEGTAAFFEKRKANFRGE